MTTFRGSDSPGRAQNLFTTMSTRITDNTPVSALSVGELRSLVEAVVARVLLPSTNATAHGMQGLADLLGCSLSQAKRIKASGLLAPAISQLGRVMVIDTEKALALWHKASHGNFQKSPIQ